MINAEQANLLEFSPQEKKILNLLAENQKGLTATAISTLVKEPRTTVNFYLKRLAEMGWARKIKQTGYPYPLWYLVEKNEIKNTVSGFFASLGINADTTITTTATNGYEQVLEAYEKILAAGKTERVFVIQGRQAPEAALKILPIEFVEKMHAGHKHKEIILEGIASEKSMAMFEQMSVRELRSHYGRLAVVYLIPDQYLNFDAEIFVFQDNIIIIQPAAKKALIIRDQNTAHALRLLISFIEIHAQKINVNEYIQELIEKKRGGKSDTRCRTP